MLNKPAEYEIKLPLMKKLFVLLSLLLFSSNLSFGDPLTAIDSNSQKVIQDPKTKVIYYLESDRRHIAAISPNGKLLWNCEVFPASSPAGHIYSFRLDEKDGHIIDVWTNAGLGAWGAIDKKTGVYTSIGAD